MSRNTGRAADPDWRIDRARKAGLASAAKRAKRWSEAEAAAYRAGYKAGHKAGLRAKTKHEG